MKVRQNVLSQIIKDNDKSARVYRSKRFQHIIGRMLKERLLRSNQDIKPHSEKIKLSDYLWAGEYEPRLLEILPSLILKKKSIFDNLEQIPKDLELILKGIKNGTAKEEFRKVSPKDYLQWIPKVGRKGKKPTLLKSYRMNQEDLKILIQLKEMGYTESEAIRLGIRLLLTKIS